MLQGGGGEGRRPQGQEYRPVLAPAPSPSPQAGEPLQEQCWALGFRQTCQSTCLL